MNISLTYSCVHRPFLVIVSSPSGVGKSTVARSIGKEGGIFLSVSATTRKKRPSEIHQRDYLFVSQDDFMRQKEKEFLEHAYVFGHYYGTPSTPVERSLEKGLDVILDVDWQGARRLKQLHPENCVSIFLLPPTAEELRKRLMKRHGNDASAIERLKSAQDEIGHYKEYDYILVNDTLAETIIHVEEVISLERWKRSQGRLSQPSVSLCRRVERLEYLLDKKGNDDKVQEILTQLKNFS